MLKIKLARFGKKGQPHYRIVINEARDKRDGSYIDQVGHYAPTQQPKILAIDVDKYQAWMTKGAQPTETVAALFTRYQSGTPFPTKKAKPSKKAVAKQAAATEEKVTTEPAATPTVEPTTENAIDSSATTTE